MVMLAGYAVADYIYAIVTLAILLVVATGFRIYRDNKSGRPVWISIVVGIAALAVFLVSTRFAIRIGTIFFLIGMVASYIIYHIYLEATERMYIQKNIYKQQVAYPSQSVRSNMSFEELQQKINGGKIR